MGDEGRAKLLVAPRNRELRKGVDHVLGRAEEDAGVCGGEHAGVVVGVACRDHPEVESAQRLHGAALAVLHA
jgi:hypothetical protein